MRRLVIVCERATEQEFCRKLFAAYLTNLEIAPSTLIKKAESRDVARTSICKQRNVY